MPPAPLFVPPMLAGSVRTLPEGPEREYELKLDSYRLEAIKDCILSFCEAEPTGHVNVDAANEMMVVDVVNHVEPVVARHRVSGF